MAVDVFLKLTGVKGEAHDSKHKEEIDVLSYSLGVSNAGTSSYGGGSGAGRASFSDLSIMKRVDNASPTLLKFCATGEHVDEAVMTVRKAGGSKAGGEPYLVITMNEVLVTSVQESGSSEEPTESVSLNYSKIHYVYKPQKADGTLGAQVEFSYDLKAQETK